MQLLRTEGRRVLIPAKQCGGRVAMLIHVKWHIGVVAHGPIG
jgi:hypothetical protein